MHELNTNLLAIFDQWDTTISDELISQSNVGFYNAGIFIKHKKMLRYLRKCSTRKDHGQVVRANEFPKFMGMIAGNQYQDTTSSFLKSQPIPKERLSPSHYLDIMDAEKRRRSKSGGDDDGDLLDALDNVVSAEFLMANNIFDPRIMFEYVTFQRGVFPAVFAFFFGRWDFPYSTGHMMIFVSIVPSTTLLRLDFP